MTREEALQMIPHVEYAYNTENFIQGSYAAQQWFDAVEKALKVEPCDDCISRQAAIVALDNRMSSLEKVNMQIAMGFAKGIINELPSVTPAEKVGHWTHDGSHWKNRWICSECGYKLIDEQTRYCPNCGRFNGGEQDGSTSGTENP